MIGNLRFKANPKFTARRKQTLILRRSGRYDQPDGRKALTAQAASIFTIFFSDFFLIVNHSDSAKTAAFIAFLLRFIPNF
jgi:hypothetical protein